MDGSRDDWRDSGTAEAAPAVATLPYVRRLDLTDFRCYAAARIEAAPGINVLTGPNGAGKTNLLEALSVLVPGRGLRGIKPADAARREAGEPEDAPPRAWAVAGRIASRDGEVRLGTGLEPGSTSDRRQVRIEGETQKSQAALADHLACVWLTPQMDGLFVDSPGARRRFLDRLVYAFDPVHAGRVSAYEKAMRERARLLADRGLSADPHWLSALEETMATKGVAVAAARLETADALDAAAARGHGPFPGARIRVAGAVEETLGSGPALEAEDKLKADLAASRGEDAESGRTAHGPHRSDLAVRHAAKDQPAERCSTGEQKALLVGIVLASAALRGRAEGLTPVLLLDEVAAHLDEDRRAALYDRLAALGGQVWLTGTDRGLFQALEGRARFFRVENAAVAAE